MSSWNVSKTDYERLMQHLVDLEESREQWLIDHFRYHSPERDQMNNLLDRYIQKLLSFTSSLEISSDAGNQLPFVIMGSQVAVYQVDRKRHANFRILPIYEERISSGDISILSPLGNAILFKKSGDLFYVQTPLGSASFKVEAITFQPRN